MAVNYLIINTFNTNTISDSVVTDFGDINGAIPRYDEQKKLFGMNGQYNIEDGLLSDMKMLKLLLTHSRSRTMYWNLVINLVAFTMLIYLNQKSRFMAKITGL